jgi:hypothetical protein
VDSRDVLDVNARTTKEFGATVRGHFRRTGPNSWDDYEFVSDVPETIQVAAGIEIQLERGGTDLRLRRSGKVFRVRWEPTLEEAASLSNAEPTRRRAHLVAHYLDVDPTTPGIGVGAFIASKLSH